MSFPSGSRRPPTTASRSWSESSPPSAGSARRDRGKVVQRVTHEEMRDVEGPYARLIEAQAWQDGHAG
jgi:hypothetical protein